MEIGPLSRYRAQLALGARITIAAVATLGIGHLLGTPMILWAVLTAVILTQMSVGRSVKATIDYSFGTLGGAIYAGLVSNYVPGAHELALLLLLGLAIAPLALLSALTPRFSVAPATGVIVVLAPTITHATAFHSAYDRVLEVALGGAVALVVSHLVFPARARILALEAGAEMLAVMAEALAPLFSGFARPQDPEAIRDLQRGVGDAFARLDKMEQEARHERIVFLEAEPDLAPLLRALLRMRHDLVMIGRAAVTPLPERLRPRLETLLARIAEAAAAQLLENGAALTNARAPVVSKTLDAAFDAYSREITALREEGILRGLPVEQVEHVFALGFALEQWRGDLDELERRIAERAR
ncbi:fusaric acid resistance family protein [Methylosinus sp. sav-2]|uniref:FUSC family protein n=1 Tax=Methylosinus sp. sav-2 TaxID=2485168 RepID=UPI000478BB59|nr:FUSC family protein [Methylosinus sp. sav-2]TDX63387.1 fusaric acid resistance family protein [Methylosinus sp. sav-2]